MRYLYICNSDSLRNTCLACAISKRPVEHLSSVFLEANKLCSLSAVGDWGYRCRQVNVIFFFFLWKNHAKRMALHMHELYEGLIGGTNSMSFLTMKVRNVKHLCTQW